LTADPKRLEKSFDGFQPEAARVLIQPSRLGLAPLVFDVDFIGGQKTGFFLDQRSNIELAARSARGLILDAKNKGRSVKILDLFCYVGQWGAQLAHLARAEGVKAEVTIVDASMKALELAKANVERHGGIATIEKRDVLEDIKTFENGGFDIVICDPPAFVKKKKDLPTGTQAYFKLNREALRKTMPGGLFVSCSCSGLFGEAEFREMLSRVAVANDRRVRWVARGSHSADHPQRPEFPQGTYLKSWMGIVDS
jgi:23S rRNA (cytosine1962-C5)-methyltransferase